MALKYLLSEKADLCVATHHLDVAISTYLDVCTALIIFLTLPVTVASAERSFSKLFKSSALLVNWT